MRKPRKTIRVLITAGPTREYIDPVRYLSNDSSGRMGFALAQAAVRMGYKVALIAGPVSLPTPDGVKRIDVVSAPEMRRAVLAHAPKADVIIMAAAVSDWRPAKTSLKKIKRTNGRTDERTLLLKETPDILAELGRKKRPGQILVGFALETESLEKNAREKLARKKCDWIVANTASAIGSKSSRAILLSRDGRRIPLPRMPKDNLAFTILSYIL